MERRIKFIPAWDKRHSDPKQDYGIHNAEIRFLLIGPEGAIQFVISTGWQLPHVEKEQEHLKPLRGVNRAWATDIGYHSYTPRYEDQTLITDSCEVLGGKPCYYDGSSLNAEPIFHRLLAEGDKAVWEEMEKWYLHTFTEPK